jgi:hypothetical protein
MGRGYVAILIMFLGNISQVVRIVHSYATILIMFLGNIPRAPLSSGLICQRLTIVRNSRTDGPRHLYFYRFTLPLTIHVLKNI